MKKKLSIFLLLAGNVSIVFAQNEPGTVITIHAAILKETRKIQVYSPATGGSGKQGYPVIYVLDGESLYWPVIGAMRFMNYSSYMPQMPEALIVSIPNTKRDRDMPVPQEILKTNGAKNFLHFLSEEVVPYINKHYPTNGLNVLIGHSQGGLFVTYAGLEKPGLFPFILALDAPMTVNHSLLKDYQQRLGNNCRLNYFTGETLFGWRNEFSKPAGCENYSQKGIEEETHETMPYKGIYEGLKFLFREHIPAQTDMALPALQEYYSRLSQKYNCRYAIPAKLLLACARNSINQSKKQEALALITYFEKAYGKTQLSGELLAKANAITRVPDERVSFYLNHPTPSAEAIQPFLGKWKGTLYVPGGTDMNITWEIKRAGDKYVMAARIEDSFNSLSDFMMITDKNELAWGRKHNGGGIYLSVGKLSADGILLSGEENLIGFEMPAGVAPFVPNRFEFRKLSN